MGIAIAPLIGFLESIAIAKAFGELSWAHTSPWVWGGGWLWCVHVRVRVCVRVRVRVRLCVCGKGCL